MMDPALIHGFEFGAPPGQQAEALGAVANFIAQVVGPAAERIDVIEVLVQAFRQQEGDDVEILVVMRCEPARVFFGGWYSIAIVQRLRRVYKLLGGELRHYGMMAVFM